MKKNWIITLTLPVVIAGLLVVVKFWPRTVPWEECSPVFRQYADREGIKASYVRDYPVNDTTLVDVTLLQATTDSAWEKLCIEFTPYEFSDSSEYIHRLIHNLDVTFRPVAKDDPRKKITPNGIYDFNLVIQTAKVKSIGIFHIKNKTQFEATFITMATNTLFTNNKSLI